GSSWLGAARALPSPAQRAAQNRWTWSPAGSPDRSRPASPRSAASQDGSRAARPHGGTRPLWSPDPAGHPQPSSWPSPDAHRGPSSVLPCSSSSRGFRASTRPGAIHRPVSVPGMDRQWSVRDQHRADVLALLHRGRKLTRGEIAEALRLTRSTVSDILGGLLDQGIITDTEQRAPGGRGRPAEVLGIHPGAVRFVGIDFSHSACTLCLANSAGKVIASATVEYADG